MKKLLNFIPVVFFIFLLSLLSCSDEGGDGPEKASYSVTYIANGATSGDLPVDSDVYEKGETVTVMVNSGNLAKSGYTLAGWSDGASTYTEGSTFVMGDANVTLNAVWSSADAQWARSMVTGNDYSSFWGSSVGSDGSIYAAGFINGSNTFNFGNSVTATGISDYWNIILVKYDSLGIAKWARTVSSVTSATSESILYSVAIGSDGSVYAAGYVFGSETYSFGNSVSVTGISDYGNIFIVKYDSNGIAQWAKTITSVTSTNSDSFFNSITVTADGSVYAAGSIYGTETYNFGNSITAAGKNSGYNVVLVKYNSSGLTQWAKTVISGSNDNKFNTVSVASDGSVYAGGVISGSGVFDFGNSVTATGNGYGSILLVKYNSSGTPQWAKTITSGSYYSWFLNLTTASDGSIYACGVIGGTETFNFGNNVTANGVNSDNNMLLVKYNSSGAAQWAKTVTSGNTVSTLWSVSVAPDDSVNTAGTINGTGSFSFGNNVTATGYLSGNNMIILNYSSSGEAQWAKTSTGGSYYSYIYSLSTASDGSVYAAGDIGGTLPLDLGNNVTVSGPYSGSTYSDNILLVKYK